MNSQTQNSDQTARSYRNPNAQIADELERLWLLSAIRVGLDQVARGETLVADDAFFKALETRLFDRALEPAIEA